MIREWTVSAVLVGVLTSGLVFAQGRGATAAQARAYIYGAFLTQAAPGIMAENVKLGPELEQRLKLPAGADSGRIYEALIAITDGKALDVRGASEEEVAGYGSVPGLDAALPSYALVAGEQKFLVQYDLEVNAIPFVGQLGIRPLAAKPATAQMVATRGAEFDPKKPSIVTLVWSESFEFNRAALNPEVRAKIDADVLPKLKDFAEIRYINVNGHSDMLGSPTYNQQLSEKRAEAVRTYLVAQGASADKIEVFGFGKTLPVKSCKEEMGRRAKIECLAPNRRVQIEVQGLLRAGAQQQ
ncbi:MAG: OmpA-OmpF porin, family [Betaproteobacteria bacterium]|jgi:outer membrane protein OmpA-like peptidoglycan-associated protein|nr:OmpA-OmpF porin, family [Betaproteobacteria bacterium]